MKTIKRTLLAFVFYPLFVLWFIPKQWFSANKKAEFEIIYKPDPENPGEQIREERKRSPEERKAVANLLFNTELQVALAGHRRASSKKERKAVYTEHLKAIKNSQEDEIFKELGIKDE